MRLTAYGAARNVTGSKHLLTVGGRRVLLDCGLVQGPRAESERRNRSLPFHASSIDAVLLTHAHLDHSGSLPTLVKSGFRGTILATHATADLAPILLADAAYLQELDARYLNARRRRGEREVLPIYTQRDAEVAAARFAGVDYGRPVQVVPGVTATFREAGHILGSAILEITAREAGRSAAVVFTGDLGRPGMPILRDPENVREADVLLTESTYGSRVHASVGDALERLARFVSRVAARRGKIIVPAFAVGRTQAIVYELHALMRERRIPSVPIFVDSPLALRATEILKRHPECFDADMNALIRRDDDPLGFSRVTYVQSAGDSQALDRRPGPMVIVSASGMCEGGRVLHHLKAALGSRRNAVMIVGYQAEGTLGRRIADGIDRVRILGGTYAVRAEVAAFDEFSSHADREGLLAFAKGIRRTPRRTVVVHGSEEDSLSLASLLSENGFPGVIAPLDGESIEF